MKGKSKNFWKTSFGFVRILKRGNRPRKKNENASWPKALVINLIDAT